MTWRFLPPAGQGRVLVTSQSQHWPDGWVLDVRVLDGEVATQFLLKRTASADRAAARDLAEELGGLPLALEQAGGYVRATATTLARYLTLFRDRRAALLDRGEPAGHRQTVAATLALARLEAEAPPAAGLLRLLACLAPEPVPLELLLSGASVVSKPDPEVAPVLAALLGDAMAAGDAVAALRRYSLITSAGDGLVLVHRLVQAVTLAQTPARLAAGWQNAAAELVEAAIPADLEPPPATWPVFALLLPHARAVLAADSNGLSRIANHLGFRGNYKDARDLHRGIVVAREQVRGPQHPDTLTVRGALADHTGEAGDPAAARAQLAALLPVRERVSGPEHNMTLNVRDDLAEATGQAGDPAAARDQYAALVPAYERILGLEHYKTLRARAELAYWTGQAGDAAGAREQLAVLLPIRERVLGPEHPDILTTRNNLTYWTGEMGGHAGLG